MEEELLKKFEQAIKLSDEILEFSKPLVNENVKALDLAEKIENEIRKRGAKPSWPVNISINEIAAHYTPEANDILVLKENDLVKVDFGVQIDGCISDRAFTVCIGKKTHPLIEASKKAVEETLKILKPGVKVFELSEVMENVVTSFGFNPIRNLSGHGMEQYNQHAEPSIPNGKNNIQDEVGVQPMAIEVFATDGRGWVKESTPNAIYRYREDKPVRMWEARQVLEISKKEFDRLPFAKRWIKNVSPLKIDLALRQLEEAGAIDTYPPLKEETNGLVAVTENTIVVK